MINKCNKVSTRFAVCVDTDDPDLLTAGMGYQVLPDDNAEKSDYLRVIDNEGESYLHPARYFVLVDFPHPIQKVILRTNVPVMRSVDSELIA